MARARQRLPVATRVGRVRGSSEHIGGVDVRLDLVDLVFERRQPRVAGVESLLDLLLLLEVLLERLGQLVLRRARDARDSRIGTLPGTPACTVFPRSGWSPPPPVIS